MHDDMPELTGAILLFTDASGQYIPQRFAQEIERVLVENISDEDWKVLDGGPDETGDYWQAWDEVLTHAILKDTNGTEFYLYQDGDLWAVPMDQHNETPELTSYEYACMSAIDGTCGFFPFHLFDTRKEALRYNDDTILGALGV